MKHRVHSVSRWAIGIAVLSSAISAVTTAYASPCPDLSGTYAVGRTVWIDKLLLGVTGTVRPKGQAPQLATLRPREDGYALTWHMPRNAFLAAADQLSAREPHQYGVWLDMTLRDPPTFADGGEQQDWFNRVAFLGPVFRADVVLPKKSAAQCDGGWFLVGSQSRAGPPDMEGGMDGNRDAQLWLQRRDDGSLALRWRERRKWVVISESRYTTESSIPLWSSDHVETWPAAAKPDLEPLRADELPSRNRPPKCRVIPDEENAFFKRLDAILPAQATQSNRTRGGVYNGRMRPDGTCEPMPYWVTITAANAADLATVEAYLKTDPYFARMETQESETLRDGRVIGRFKMVVVP